ncbi:MAG: hypothetical protein ACR2PA_26060 [Hyphomicrobiaceae bacterium]
MAQPDKTGQPGIGDPPFVTIDRIWTKYRSLRSKLEELDDWAPDSSDSVYRSELQTTLKQKFVDPIDSELLKLVTLAAGLRARNQAEIRYKAMMMRDHIQGADLNALSALADSLAKDLTDTW